MVSEGAHVVHQADGIGIRAVQSPGDHDVIETLEAAVVNVRVVLVPFAAASLEVGDINEQMVQHLLSLGAGQGAVRWCARDQLRRRGPRLIVEIAHDDKWHCPALEEGQQQCPQRQRLGCTPQQRACFAHGTLEEIVFVRAGFQAKVGPHALEVSHKHRDALAVDTLNVGAQDGPRPAVNGHGDTLHADDAVWRKILEKLHVANRESGDKRHGGKHAIFIGHHHCGIGVDPALDQGILQSFLVNDFLEAHHVGVHAAQLLGCPINLASIILLRKLLPRTIRDLARNTEVFQIKGGNGQSLHSNRCCAEWCWELFSSLVATFNGWL
eukprot:m.14043 g.14043  ORF g.14043 m.14043 type:complete len:325 (-) comp6326_c1_seq1:800-1774(-)